MVDKIDGRTRKGRAMRAETRTEAEGERRRRDVAMTGKNLGIPTSILDTAKYKYHWLNDEAANARIMVKTVEDDWDLVAAEDPTGATITDDLGKCISRVVGANKDGSPKRAYLARKLKTFHEEDQRQKQAEVDGIVDQLRHGHAGADSADYVHRNHNIR